MELCHYLIIQSVIQTNMYLNALCSYFFTHMYIHIARIFWKFCYQNPQQFHIVVLCCVMLNNWFHTLKTFSSKWHLIAVVVIALTNIFKYTHSDFIQTHNSTNMYACLRIQREGCVRHKETPLDLSKEKKKLEKKR